MRTTSRFTDQVVSKPCTVDQLADYLDATPRFVRNEIAAGRLRARRVEFFEQSGIRPTLLVFAADDPTAKESAAKTIRFFGDAADYLLVENPAKFKSDDFKKTALRAWLGERSTPTLRIPAITALTMNAWETLERKLKRYLPLEEASQQKELHELSRYELGFLRDRFLVQFEDFAGQVLPDINLVKNKVARSIGPRTETQDPLSDPFLLTV